MTPPEGTDTGKEDKSAIVKVNRNRERSKEAQKLAMDLAEIAQINQSARPLEAFGDLIKLLLTTMLGTAEDADLLRDVMNIHSGDDTPRLREPWERATENGQTHPRQTYTERYSAQASKRAGTAQGEDPLANIPADVKEAFDSFIALVRKREGYSETVYPDGDGRSVGIGHHIKETDPEWGLKVGDKVSRQRIMELFHQDAEKAFESAIEQAKEANIDAPDFIGALASVNFQLGTEWTKEFYKTWPAIKNGDYIMALKNLEKSQWNIGKKDQNGNLLVKGTKERVDDFQIAIIRLAAKMGKPVPDDVQIEVAGKVIIPVAEASKLEENKADINRKPLKTGAPDSAPAPAAPEEQGIQ